MTKDMARVKEYWRLAPIKGRFRGALSLIEQQPISEEASTKQYYSGIDFRKH